MEENTCWFKNWFNSKYYHLLYKNRDDVEASRFLEHLLYFLQATPDSRFWDLCCGKGRHARYINSKGYAVTGTDLSEESIRFAAGFENNHLHFYRHDMRQPFYSNYFDYVLNLFTSFGYFEQQKEDARVFKSVQHALKKNGLFVLDYLNVDKAIEQLRAFDEKEIEGVSFRISKEIRQNFIVKQIQVNDQGQEFHFQEQVKLLRLKDFELLGQNAGFTLIYVFGDYSLAKFAPGFSERLILLFKK